MCGVFIFPELYKSISDGTLKARYIRGKKRDCTCLVVFPVPGKFEPTNLHVDNNGKRDTGKFSEASSPKWLVIPANTVVEKVTSDIPPGLYGNFFALELDKWVVGRWKLHQQQLHCNAIVRKSTSQHVGCCGLARRVLGGRKYASHVWRVMKFYVFSPSHTTKVTCRSVTSVPFPSILGLCFFLYTEHKLKRSLLEGAKKCSERISLR